MKIGKVVEIYIGLRNDLAEARSEFKNHEKVVKAEMLDLEMKILEAAEEMGVDSFKTPFGTAYQTTKTYTSLEDREALIKYVSDSGDFGVFTSHVAKNHILELMDEGLAPSSIGIQYSEERAINIRKS